MQMEPLGLDPATTKSPDPHHHRRGQQEQQTPPPPPPSPMFLHSQRRRSSSSSPANNASAKAALECQSSSQLPNPVADDRDDDDDDDDAERGSSPSSSHHLLLPDVTMQLQANDAPTAIPVTAAPDASEMTVAADPKDDDEDGCEAGNDSKRSAYYLDLLEATCKSLHQQHEQVQQQRQQPDIPSGAAAAKIDPDVIGMQRNVKESLDPAGVTSTSGNEWTSECKVRHVREEEERGMYRLKWIDYKRIDHVDHKEESKKTAIITQNENGPCPLIAIMNVLLLKGDLILPSIMDIVTADQLMEYLGDSILANMPKNLTEGAQLNYEQNMMDAIAILPKLQTGLDVNVKFTHVNDFEFTPELIVFDLLRIPLYHGWLIDPINEEHVAKAVGSCSYNQLVDKIINNKFSQSTKCVTEALLAEEFLEATATQLTYYGLEELLSHVKHDDPCVLFRNNHFITLFKRKNQLFQLVTDQGFLSEPSVIWETLCNIEGDGEFVDHEFVLVPPKTITSLEYMTAEEVKHQEDQDYLLALSLQEEYKKELEQLKESGMEGLSDEELARRLQAEEQQQQQQQQQSSSTTAVQQMKNLKIQQHSTGKAGSSGCAHHHQHQQQQPQQQNANSRLQDDPRIRSEDHANRSPGMIQQNWHAETEDGLPQRNQASLRPSSSGAPSTRRRTMSDSYDVCSSSSSPAGQGNQSDSGGGSGGGGYSAGSQRRQDDHRRNKSNCLVM